MKSHLVQSTMNTLVAVDWQGNPQCRGRRCQLEGRLQLRASDVAVGAGDEDQVLIRHGCGLVDRIKRLGSAPASRKRRARRTPW
jgi:hypothetical protein